MKPIASKTFVSELIREGSWGCESLGKHEFTMDLYEVEGNAGRLFIQWDISTLEQTEEIGISVEMIDGKRTLCDYDGVFSLPAQAIELLESVGIVVGDDYR